MADFVIHGVPGSPYARAVLMGLEEKGAAWRLAPMAPGMGKSAEHLERHPFGRTPVFEHGDFRLYETQAILRYIDRILPGPALTPADPRLEARMNQICGISDFYVFPDIGAGISFGRLVAPMFGLPVDEAKIAASIPKAEICMNEVARLLGDQPFMAGPAISIADLMIAPHLAFFLNTPEGRPMFATRPGLANWMERMLDRSAIKNTDGLLLRAMAAA
jgi:glutathione S-transferase